MTPQPSPRTRPATPLVLRLAVVLGFVLLALTGVASPAAAAGHHVTIASYAYSPNPLTIAQGDTVTWTNTDSVGHDITVTSGPATFQSPLLSKGQSWSYTFTAAGTYSYICSVHPDMRATVSVTQAPAPAPASATTPMAGMSGAQPQVAQPRSGIRTVQVPAHTSATKAPISTMSAMTGTATSATQTSAAPQTSGPSLSPLLLIAGVAFGAVVFCLLLLGSRPTAAANLGD